MSRVFIDANIPMYAAGTPHPLKAPCQAVMMAAAAGRIDAVTDAEVLQEILYRYLRIGRREAGFRVFDNFRRLMLGRIFPIDHHDMQAARELAETATHLSPRDLVHLAVMRRRGVAEIVTTDVGFDGAPGITRIDPASFVG